ncbi:MAG: hypothetical protein HC831_27000 [Chloroflexia bacterium]|nr:hypothetical protein [Chloroflexia bacterium]
MAVNIGITNMEYTTANKAETGFYCLRFVLQHFGLSWQHILPLKTGPCNPVLLCEHAEGAGLLSFRADLQPESVANFARFPCIVEWGTGYFVVLKKATKSMLYLYDPLKGHIALDVHDVLLKLNGTGQPHGSSFLHAYYFMPTLKKGLSFKQLKYYNRISYNILISCFVGILLLAAGLPIIFQKLVESLMSPVYTGLNLFLWAQLQPA